MNQATRRRDARATGPAAGGSDAGQPHVALVAVAADEQRHARPLPPAEQTPRLVRQHVAVDHRLERRLRGLRRTGDGSGVFAGAVAVTRRAAETAAERRRRARAVRHAESVADLLTLLLLLPEGQRGPEAHAPVLVARALRDRPREEAPAQRAHELGDHALTAGRLAEDRDAPRVAAEGGDVAAHPVAGRPSGRADRSCPRLHGRTPPRARGARGSRTRRGGS